METERLTPPGKKQILEFSSLLVRPVFFLVYLFFLWINRTKSNICIMLYSWLGSAGSFISIL